MNMPTYKTIALLLAVILLPGGVFLLLFPKQTGNLMDDVKSRVQRYREARQQ